MLTTEQREIRALAREFAEGEIRPHSRAWDESGDFPDEVLDALAELGFMGMLVPEARGGLGMAVPAYLAVMEALSWGDAALALTVAIQNGPIPRLLTISGTEEQQSVWLPRLASGRTLGCFALSEADAGSDPSAMVTEASRTGSGWEIRGEKRWVTNGARADVAFVFARTGQRDDGRPAIGCFAVDTSDEAYRVTGREATMGLRASETVTVSLDGVVVGDDRLLGDPARGLSYALEALDIGRLGIAAQAVGIGQAALEHATRYSKERRQFGQAISGFGAIRGKLSRMAARVGAARALLLDVGARVEMDGASDPERMPLRAEAAMAKLVASEAATWVADEAVQIFGGYGYMRDYPVEQLLRDAKGTEIYEGTSEIMRLVIAEAVLGHE
ncbi:MAG: acyl-CoA dehydrogenase family protein [Gemmatimonadota bacterium]|nr:acyl-CoA dehydrogenase family protein [Gemmatimonadota bacterium]